MRIISGEFRGRTIKAPPRDSRVRPTPDRIRENLFNILMPHIMDASVLDLFAGTGAPAIEALSRGAAQIVMADKSADSVRLIKDNLASLKIGEDRARVIHADYRTALRFLRGERYDIILLDPPFAEGLYCDCLREIANHDILVDGGIIVIEHHGKTELKTPFFTVIDERRYGSIRLTFLTDSEAERR